MQKWEYLHVSFDTGDSKTIDVFFNEECHEYEDANPGEVRFTTLASLGEQGWELVTADAHKGVYIFKRPK